MKQPLRIIAAVFLNESNELLLLKRTEKRKSYPGKWNVLSAVLEENETPKDCLDREVEEELGTTSHKVLEEAEPYLDIQKEGSWLVRPFLCKIEGEIKLDPKEHDEFRWVPLDQIDKFDLVPGVKKDLQALGLL